LAQNNIPERGVYAIQCNDGRAYVGSSTGIARRWREHRSVLKHHRHHSPSLQAAWDALGPEAFTFVVLEAIPQGDLVEAEQRWMDALASASKGFNCAPNAGTNAGTERPAELRERLSMALTAYWENPAERERQSRVLQGVSAGVRNASARLSEADVLEIRRLKAGGSTLSELSAMYGVGKSNVSHIVTRRNWRHI
jgi:group I intron endonuclease